MLTPASKLAGDPETWGTRESRGTQSKREVIDAG
jgi:hypothetical protein